MNYFLAPRSGEKRHGNYESTIKNGVPIERINSFFSPEELNLLRSEDVIYAWGNREGTKSAWEKMQSGDKVIFYAHGSLVLVGEVYLKKHDPQLALTLWPADENGNPWEYTFFIKNLKYIQIPIKVFNAAVDYKLNYIVQGFTRLSEDKIEKINEIYGSIEQMFDLFVDDSSDELPSREEIVHVNISSDITPIIIENINLKPNYFKPVKANLNRKKVDYVKLHKNSVIVGNKGEKIVLNYEKSLLASHGREDLAAKVIRVSDDDDTLGYDILSFQIDGKEKHIEVKATSQAIENVKFFVSTNEYNIGLNLQNYYIYFVKDVNSKKPIIMKIANPIDPSKFMIRSNGFIFEAIESHS